MDTNKMITIQKVGLISAILAAVLLIGGAAFAADTGAWTTLSVSGDVSETLSLSVGEELRFDDVADPTLARQHTDISVGYKTDLLTANVGYRNTSDGEHRPWVGVTADLFKVSILDVSTDTRFELVNAEDWRVRSEYTALLGSYVGGLSPWVSDEVFVNGDGLTGNRASVGVAKSVTDSIGVSAYYLLNTALGDTTSHSHVLGLGISVSL